MIGVDKSEPKIPPLVIVNVPPFRSSTAIVPSRALVAKPAMAFSIAANESRSASRTTGHHQPALGADGHADVEVILRKTISLPSMRALTAGNAFKASIAALMKNDMKPSATPCFF